ncbi:MAG TPA: NAD(P)-dependent oxidoreductase [Steroidobacteraceae bacterium]
MRVGYIGLGNIGAPMAERIARAGLPLTVWNRTTHKMAPLLASGAHGASSPLEVAQRCDILCLCLDSVAAAERVLFEGDGVAHAQHRPKIVVDHSTIHPDAAISLAQRLSASGIALIDAPVSGGAVGARAGTLAVMAGGAREDIAAATAVIGCYAHKITHMGPIGSGQASKACNQIVNFGTLTSIAEALALGAAFGLDIRRLPEALEGGFADSNMLREYARGAAGGDLPHMTRLGDWLASLLRGQPDPAAVGRLRMVLKDLAIVRELGHTRGTRTPVTELVEACFEALQRPRTPGSESAP